MSGNLPVIAKHTKSGVSAERATWFSRTSDIHGSHINTDMDSYLTLIRRKVQEKCATTVELITQIRRNKIGESGHVTPNEFRFTLIKFGLIFPQPLVDRIFNVFDSDRSGTMDFDEFAMWIMNSEFKPAFEKKASSDVVSPRSNLRKKLQTVVNLNRKAFTNMKQQISFLQFVADINRLALPLSDEECRRIYLVLDPKDTGFIDSSALLTWADTGRIETKREVSKPPDIKVTGLEDLISKVIGRNNRQLQSAFSHIQLGTGTKISFDEFRRCLLNAGVGKNPHHCRQLFMALGGNSGGLADIDLLFNKLAPVIDDPTTAVSLKPTAAKSISTSRADRRLRDALRKCFDIVKSDIEAADSAGSGYIDAERLFKILVHRCLPLTFQDFRFIVQQIKKEPGSTRIDYHHFLHGYNPLLPPHVLDGSSTIRGYNRSSSTPKLESTTTGNGLAMTTGSMGMNRTGPATDNASSSGNTSNNNNNAPVSVGATKRMGLSASMSDLTDASRAVAAMAASGSKDGAPIGGGDELRRMWQAVLRECHRSDPERCGQVSRAVFIAALEKCNVDKSMAPQTMNKLADTYTLSNGLVNYLHLFRSYLTDMTSKSTFKKSKLALNLKGGTGSPTKSTELKPIHAVHPWDYGYHRDPHHHTQANDPYWHHATQLPKDGTNGEFQLQKIQVPSASEKTAQQLNSQEMESLIAQYPAKVLAICKKCYGLIGPAWRPLRNQLKKVQVNNQKGNVQMAQFISILENNGVMLSKNDLAAIARSFRGHGLLDLIKFDEFLRMCMIMKDR